MREISVIPWQPRYTLTPAMARRLMEIEAARAVVEQIPLPPAVVSEMRNRARLRSTHYSTRIEGNRLTLAEAEQVLAGRKVPLHGRERDVSEVRSHWKALLRVEEWAARGAELTENLIQRIHALVEGRARPSRYRDGQNTIRDSAGTLVYLPPEAKDVPILMTGLITAGAAMGYHQRVDVTVRGLRHRLAQGTESSGASTTPWSRRGRSRKR